MYTIAFALIAGAFAQLTPPNNQGVALTSKGASPEVQGLTAPGVSPEVQGFPGVSPEVQGIGCYSDGSCPWYCIGCACCGGTCWFGAGLTHCRSMECSLCQATAAAALDMGSQAACDAGADAACMAAGAFDPIADAICPTIVVPLCYEIFGQATQPTAQAACVAIHMCSGAEETDEDPIYDEAGRLIGYPYAVCARQDENWTWDAEAEDVHPNCATFFADDIHGCHTLWMKENCAGTCRRCPGARTHYVGSPDKDKDL